jgi:GDP-4-dehydro-6-deoxy-D-mannose reductase
MKKVLITGVTGMVGSHLAEYLLAEQKDCQVFGVKRWRSNIDNIAEIKDKITTFDVDLTDLSGCIGLMQTVKPDYIFHLAANSYVPDSWINPHKTLHDNIGMEMNVFEAVRLSNLDPVIQIAGSSEQYGKVLPDEVPIKETNPFRPMSTYAVSKVAQDLLGYQYFQSYGMKIIRTRAFNHEGPRRGEFFVTSSFAKQVAEIEAGLKEPLLLVGNLDSRRDWTDVRDVVRAYWLAVQHGAPGEDYVIGSGVSRSVREMLDFLLTLSKAKIEVRVDPKRFRPSDVTALEGDCSKFHKLTGWEPKITFEQMMEDLLNYWRHRLAPQARSNKPALSK